jgi:hypothetical protein
MLMLLFAAQQRLPPVYVTVQEPPGWPEWAKILVAALAGAVFAVCLEFVKPWIVKWNTMRTVRRHLNEELLDCLGSVEKAAWCIDAAKDQGEEFEIMTLSVVEIVAGSIDNDRYRFYFEQQKAVVYEIDKDKHLSAFYRYVTHSLKIAIEDKDLKNIKIVLGMAESVGREYVKAKGLKYASPSSPITVSDDAKSVEIPID